MPRRATPQRRAVLQVVKLSTEPVASEDVAVHLPRVSRATVFRHLDQLAARGEIAEVPSDDGMRRYIGSPWHGATFTCQRCGRVRRLAGRTLPSYVDRKMFGDQLIFTSSLRATGLCAGCAKKRTTL